MSLDAFISRFNGMTEPYSFYQNTIQLQYEPKGHVYYRIENGEFVPQDGVTTVCHVIDKSDALIPWACKVMASKLLDTTPTMELPAGGKIVPQMPYADYEHLVIAAKSAHKEKLEDASDVGSAAHNWIETYIKAVLADNEPRKQELLAKFPEDPRATNCCLAALDWMEQHNVRWIFTERKIYSRRYRYAGTMDGEALVDSCTNTSCCPTPFKDRRSVIDWKCLLPEQSLMRTDGSFIRADQVMPGDTLVSYDTDTGCFVHDTVKDVQPGGTQPCVEVLSALGRRLKVSANHPVLVRGEWVNAGDLKLGDELVVRKQPFAQSSTISVDDARLLGYFIGDGGFSDKTSRTFTNTNPHVLQDFFTICKSKGFTVTPNGKKGLKRNHYNIGGCGSFLRDHGVYCCGSKTKRVPDAVLSGTKEVAIAFLSAYFDCDGYISKTSIGRPDVCFTTVSERLAAEVQELLYRLGVNANVWRQDNKQYRMRRHDSPPYWVKVNCQTESHKLLQLLDLRIESKRERQAEWLTLLAGQPQKPQRQDSVKSVTQIGELPTIAVEMEHTKTFVTSGIVTHNSSNYLYLEYLLQTAAYLQAHVEELGVKVDDRWVLRLGKEDGEFEPWHLEGDTFKADFKAFLTALNLCRSVKQLKERIKERADAIKAEKKAREQKEREERLKIKCKGADKYKGIRPPRCNAGNPCQTCLQKYADKHPIAVIGQYADYLINNESGMDLTIPEESDFVTICHNSLALNTQMS